MISILILIIIIIYLYDEHVFVSPSITYLMWFKAELNVAQKAVEVRINDNVGFEKYIYLQRPDYNCHLSSLLKIALVMFYIQYIVM